MRHALLLLALLAGSSAQAQMAVVTTVQNTPVVTATVQATDPGGSTVPLAANCVSASVGKSYTQTVGLMRVVWACSNASGTPTWVPRDTSLTESRYANAAINAGSLLTPVACTNTHTTNLGCVQPITTTGGLTGIALDTVAMDGVVHLVTFGIAPVSFSNTPVVGDRVIPTGAASPGLGADTTLSRSAISTTVGVVGSVVSTTNVDGTAISQTNCVGTCAMVNYFGSGMFGNSSTTTIASTAITAQNVTAGTCNLSQAFTVTGVTAGQKVIQMTPPAAYSLTAIFPQPNMIATANTVTVTFCDLNNALSGNIPAGAYSFTVLN